MDLKKHLPGKPQVLAGVIIYVFGWLIGGIIGSGIELVGFLLFIFGLMAWNRELRAKKHEKNK